MALDSRFDSSHIATGEKLYKQIMRDMTREDPRSALVGLGLAITHAAAACKVSRQRVFEMLQVMETNMAFNGGDPARTVSSLIVAP